MIRRAGDGTFESRVASELGASLERLADARAAGVPREDVKHAMRVQRGRTAGLTAEQRREVRRMLEDGEAYSRAEAVAWVLEMGGA